MDPPKPNDGSNNEDRKPAARNTPPRRRSQDQSSEEGRHQQQQQQQQQQQLPTERQQEQESQLQLLQRSMPQLPFLALDESSSTSELMRRLVDTGVLFPAAATAPPTGASASLSAPSNISSNNNDASSTGMDHGRLEDRLRQRLGLAQPQPQPHQPPDLATTATRLTGGSSAELQLACLEAQVLLRQQEESLRNIRMFLQQNVASASVASRAERRLPQHQMAAAAAAATTRGPANAASEAGDHMSADMLLSQLLGRAGAQTTTTTTQIPAAAAAAAPAAAQRPEAVARSASQGSTGEGDDDDDDANENVASFGADDDDLNDDDYFKDFDTEDSHKLNNETFPFRLYRMLYEVEKAGSQDIASFAGKGQVFLVHRPKRFVEEIMPKYFSTTRLASFQRQLNLYGFQRINEGGLRGGYYHKYFQKGKRPLCRKIKRQRTRAKARGSTSNTASTATGTSNASANANANVTRARQSLPTVSAPVPPTVASMPPSYSTNPPSNMATAAATAAVQNANQINQALASELARQLAAANEFNRMVEQSRRGPVQGQLDPFFLGGRPTGPNLGGTFHGFPARASATRLSLPPSQPPRNSFNANNNMNHNNLANNNLANNNRSFELYQALARLQAPGAAPPDPEQKDGEP